MNLSKVFAYMATRLANGWQHFRALRISRRDVAWVLFTLAWQAAFWVALYWVLMNVIAPFGLPGLLVALAVWTVLMAAVTAPARRRMAAAWSWLELRTGMKILFYRALPHQCDRGYRTWIFSCNRHHLRVLGLAVSLIALPVAGAPPVQAVPAPGTASAVVPGNYKTPASVPAWIKAWLKAHNLWAAFCKRMGWPTNS